VSLYRNDYSRHCSPYAQALLFSIYFPSTIAGFGCLDFDIELLFDHGRETLEREWNRLSIGVGWLWVHSSEWESRMLWCHLFILPPYTQSFSLVPHHPSSAVRRALVIAIVLRALGFISTFSAAFWLVTRRIRRSRKGLPGFGLEEVFPTR
jgi:hypothetical protein